MHAATSSWSYATTRDQTVERLRQDIEEDPPAVFVPRGNCCAIIARGGVIAEIPRAPRAGLCDDHRRRWNIESMHVRSVGQRDPSLQTLGPAC